MISLKIKRMVNTFTPVIFIFMLVLIWQFVCAGRVVPRFMLPSPVEVLGAFLSEFTVLMKHSFTTLTESIAGLLLGIVVAFCASVLMDCSDMLYKAVYPVLLISQTIPPIAIAPLLLLWMGYGMAPKIALVALVCFFPVAVGLLDGFRSADSDAVCLIRTMGASDIQLFWHIKLPYAMPMFFTGLKTSAAYSVVGAVIAEWLGGESGLGVYMTRVRKSYAFDKMFAVIFWISVLSILLMCLVKLMERKSMPYKPDTKE